MTWSVCVEGWGCNDGLSDVNLVVNKLEGNLVVSWMIGGCLLENGGKVYDDCVDTRDGVGNVVEGKLDSKYGGLVNDAGTEIDMGFRDDCGKDGT